MCLLLESIRKGYRNSKSWDGPQGKAACSEAGELLPTLPVELESQKPYHECEWETGRQAGRHTDA